MQCIRDLKGASGERW